MSARYETFQVDAVPRVEVRITAGEVAVRPATDGVVRVVVETADTEALAIGQVGNTITVAQESRWRFRLRSVRVLVDTPPGSDIDISTVSADIRLNGSFGATRLKTATGDITVDAAARLDVSTVSGSCRVGEVGSDTRLSAVAGDYSGRRVGGRLQGTTASGDIRVERVDGDVDVATTSGDIRIDRCEGDEIAAKSVSGDVTVGLPAGIRVDADLSTLSGRTVLPDRQPAAGDAPRRQVRLRLRSVSGDLRIERLAAGGDAPEA